MIIFFILIIMLMQSADITAFQAQDSSSSEKTAAHLSAEKTQMGLTGQTSDKKNSTAPLDTDLSPRTEQLLVPASDDEQTIQSIQLERGHDDPLETQLINDASRPVQSVLPSAPELTGDSMQESIDFTRTGYEFTDMPTVRFTEQLRIRIAGSSLIVPWPPESAVQKYSLLSTIEKGVTSTKQSDKTVLNKIIDVLNQREMGADGFSYYLQFICYATLNDVKNAEDSLRNLIDIRVKNNKPVFWWNYLYLGRLYSFQQQYDKSLEAYSDALKLAPDQPIAAIYTAKIYELTKKYDAAERIYKSLKEKTDDSTRKAAVDALLANLYVQEQKWDAITTLASPYMDDKTVPSSLVRYYCRALIETKQKYKVPEVLLKRISFEPDNVRWVLLLAQVYWYYETKERAVEFLNEASEKSQNNAVLCLQLASYYSLLNNDDEAIRILNSTLEKYPRFVAGMTALGRLYYARKDYPKAIFYFKKVIELNPNNPRAYYSLGTIYGDAGKKTEMRDVFAEYLKRFPNAPKRKEVQKLFDESSAIESQQTPGNKN